MGMLRASTHTHMCVHAHTHTHTHARSHTSTHACMCTHAHLDTHIMCDTCTHARPAPEASKFMPMPSPWRGHGFSCLASRGLPRGIQKYDSSDHHRMMRVTASSLAHNCIMQPPRERGERREERRETTGAGL